MAGNNGKSKGKNTVELVTQIVEPIIIGLGLELWDVRFVKEGTQWYLRVFIDKEEGITIEDCETVSHAIDEPLDEKNPIEQSYCLEVCSPGLERELIKPEHFEQFSGCDVMVKMIRPHEVLGKEFKGVLEGLEDANLKIDVSGETHTINKKETVWVKLDDFDF